MEFRPARPTDVALLKHWDSQQHVMDCDPDDEWDWEVELQREPPWREQWVAELGGTPIGFIQIIDPAEEETHYWGEVAPNQRAIDIWIGEKEHLNQGYGTRMMAWAINRCFSQAGVDSILIDPLKSNTAAHRFYERLGFVFVEERRFGGDDTYVYVLHRR